MRIRKHAKNLSQLHATSHLKPVTAIPTHVCPLNQSPWDLISDFSPPTSPLPPPLFKEWDMQVDGDELSAGNGSSMHHHRPSLVECGLNSKLEDERDMNKLEDAGQIALCCKTDGKSWRCKREAIKDNSLCEHHLSQVKSYYYNSTNNNEQDAALKSSKKKKETDSNKRNRKPKKGSSSSNPNEFYYYSGFGPRWGKKRAASVDVVEREHGGGDDDDEETNTAEQLMANNDDDHEEFDYKGEDDDEEEDEDVLIDGEGDSNGKKRPRKPIKARSLKSLM